MPQVMDKTQTWERHQRMMRFLASRVDSTEWKPGDTQSLPAHADWSALQALCINLDVCTDLRQRIEEQLTVFAIPYRRIRAVE
jgi:hypothetical protein